MKAFSCSFANFIAGCSAAAAAVAAVSILNSPVKPERSADPGRPHNAPDRRIGSRGSGQARGAAIHSSAQVARVPERQFQRDSTAGAFVRSCATRRPVKLLQRTASAASRDDESFPNRWSRLGHQEPKDRCTKQGPPWPTGSEPTWTYVSILRDQLRFREEAFSVRVFCIME